MNRFQKAALAEQGEPFVSAAEHRARGDYSLESRRAGGKFAVTVWYASDDLATAEWQARYLARNFNADYRVRDSRGKVVLFVESTKRGV